MRAGDAGWLWIPTVRYCSFTDLREPVSWREDEGETAPGLPGLPLPNPPWHFPPPQLLGRRGGGCWSWGTLQAAQLRSPSIATRLEGRAPFQLSSLLAWASLCLQFSFCSLQRSFTLGFASHFWDGVGGGWFESGKATDGGLNQMEPTVT